MNKLFYIWLIVLFGIISCSYDETPCDCVYVTVIDNDTSYTLYEGTFYNYLQSDPFTGSLIFMYETCDRQYITTQIHNIQ